MSKPLLLITLGCSQLICDQRRCCCCFSMSFKQRMVTYDNKRCRWFWGVGVVGFGGDGVLGVIRYITVLDIISDQLGECCTLKVLGSNPGYFCPDTSVLLSIHLTPCEGLGYRIPSPLVSEANRLMDWIVKWVMVF